MLTIIMNWGKENSMCYHYQMSYHKKLFTIVGLCFCCYMINANIIHNKIERS